MPTAGRRWATDVAAPSRPGTGDRRTAGGRVLVVDPTPAGCRLTVLTGRGACTVDLPCTPNPVAARRWLAAVRRVERVELSVDPARPDCVVTGRSNRLPFVRRVPVAVGLGLGVLGARLWLDGSAGDTTSRRQPWARTPRTGAAGGSDHPR